MSKLTLLLDGSGEERRLDKLLTEVGSRLAGGEPVRLQASLRSPKLRAPFLKLARKHRAESEIVLECRTIHRRLQIPTYAEDVDRIEIRQNVRADDEAAAFFQDNEEELVNRPHSLFRQMEREGLLLRFIPEYRGTIGLDQHSPYHTYNVFDHILQAASFVAGTNPKMVWTLLLHDIGKGYPGIKQFFGVFVKPYASFSEKERVVIENGGRIRDGLDSGDTYRVGGIDVPRECIKTDLVGHFYDHENVGAQLALKILPRLGYSPEFAHEVATLVQFHMTMPRNVDTISPSALQKWYARVGRYAAELMMVRLADDRGKM